MFQFTFTSKEHFSSRFFCADKKVQICVWELPAQKKTRRCISLAAADKIDFPEQTRHSTA
jgi:hypothetical protein